MQLFKILNWVPKPKENCMTKKGSLSRILDTADTRFFHVWNQPPSPQLWPNLNHLWPKLAGVIIPYLAIFRAVTISSALLPPPPAKHIPSLAASTSAYSFVGENGEDFFGGDRTRIVGGKWRLGENCWREMKVGPGWAGGREGLVLSWVSRPPAKAN